MRLFRWRHLTVLAPLPSEPKIQGSFRGTENSNKGVAGQAFPIVHTAHAFGRRLAKLPKIKTA